MEAGGEGSQHHIQVAQGGRRGYVVWTHNVDNSASGPVSVNWLSHVNEKGRVWLGFKALT